MLTKVISGGQTGVDISALMAAKSLGIETGGFMPKGWLTEEGPKPFYEKEFGMQEHSSPRYEDRTRANVDASDVILILCANPSSSGTRFTKKCAVETDKPIIQILQEAPKHPSVTARRLELYDITVLNVAGNRESNYPGIQAWAFEYLQLLFMELIGNGKCIFRDELFTIF